MRGARRAAILGAAGLLLAGCFGDDGDGSATTDSAGTVEPTPTDLHPSDAVADGGTLRIGVESFPATFNPVHVDGVDSSAPQILAPTFGSAVAVDADPSTGSGSWTVDPDYATSVEVIDDDPLTVRVELNEDAVWQGGTPITSADMVAFVAAVQDDEHAAAVSPVFDDVESVEPDGPFAYEVVFAEPNAEWPVAVYPALPAAITKDAKVFNTTFARRAPSANGPYRVASIERRTGTITLERNPRWWGRRPKLDTIVFRIGEPEVLADAFVAGELEAVPVSAANREMLAEEPLRVSSGSDWSHLTINGGAGPLADAKVRRAVLLAVDTDGIVAATSARYGAPAAAMDSVVLLPGQVGHVPDPGAGRDLARAQKLLADAGWERTGDTGPVTKDGKPLVLSLPVPETMSGAVERADLVAEDLREVGIEVAITEVPGATFFEDVVIPLDFDLTTFTWEGSAFPLAEAQRRFTPIDSPLNFTGTASRAITEAFERAIGTLDAGSRADRIATIDKVARAQASILPLAVIPRVLAVDPEVVNYGPTALADLDWTVVGFAQQGDD